MNKCYDQTDQERDQSRKLEQQEARKHKSRQPRSEDSPRPQQGGWGDDLAKRPSAGGSDESEPAGGRTQDEP